MGSEMCIRDSNKGNPGIESTLSNLWGVDVTLLKVGSGQARQTSSEVSALEQTALDQLGLIYSRTNFGLALPRFLPVVEVISRTSQLRSKLTRAWRRVHFAKLIGGFIGRKPHTALNKPCKCSRRLPHMTAVRQSS